MLKKTVLNRIHSSAIFLSLLAVLSSSSALADTPLEKSATDALNHLSERIAKSSSSNEIAENYFWRSFVNMAKGEYAAAANDASQSLAKSQGTDEGALLRKQLGGAIAYLGFKASGASDKAQSMLNELIASGEQKFRAYDVIKLLAHSTGAPTAREIWQKFQSFGPESGAVNVILGFNAIAEKQNDEAKEFAKRANIIPVLKGNTAGVVVSLVSRMMQHSLDATAPNVVPSEEKVVMFDAKTIMDNWKSMKEQADELAQKTKALAAEVTEEDKLLVTLREKGVAKTVLDERLAKDKAKFQAAANDMGKRKKNLQFDLVWKLSGAISDEMIKRNSRCWAGLGETKEPTIDVTEQVTAALNK